MDGIAYDYDALGLSDETQRMLIAANGQASKAALLKITALEARIAELEARQVPGWQEMTHAGQVKVGDFITFNIGETRYLERVKVVIHEGAAEEELIYNKKKNFYVIVHNVLTGFGNVKNFRYLAAPSPADSGEVKPSDEDIGILVSLQR